MGKRNFSFLILGFVLVFPQFRVADDIKGRIFVDSMSNLFQACHIKGKLSYGDYSVGIGDDR